MDVDNGRAVRPWNERGSCRQASSQELADDLAARVATIFAGARRRKRASGRIPAETMRATRVIARGWWAACYTSYTYGDALVFHSVTHSIFLVCCCIPPAAPGSGLRLVRETRPRCGAPTGYSLTTRWHAGTSRSREGGGLKCPGPVVLWECEQRVARPSNYRAWPVVSMAGRCCFRCQRPPEELSSSPARDAPRHRQDAEVGCVRGRCPVGRKRP